MNKALQRYFELLDVENRDQLENRVVAAIIGALEPNQAIPVRLSSIAPKFEILPKPEIASFPHDGEIRFDEGADAFVIRLCSQHNAWPMRQRFTYAHEFAHRFFFIRTTEGWCRAQDLAFEDSATTNSERLKARRVLREFEEGLCNTIARRVLLPDDFVATQCDLDRWFDDAKTFASRLDEAARRAGVSRQTLLVRLSGSLPANYPKSRYAFTLEVSQGTMVMRGAEKLRAGAGIFPGPNLRNKVLYPGADIEALSPGTLTLFSDVMTSKRREAAALTLPIRDKDGEGVSILLDGWCRRMNVKQMLVWGTAQQMGAAVS